MPAKSKAQQRWAGLMYGNPELRKQSGISKSSARKLAKTKHDNLPEKVTEAMNFTEFCESLVDPLYQVEGELPKCPPGYRFDKKTMDCVPKTDADKVGKDQKDASPANGEASYKVFGRTGLNGDGYAWEDKGGNWGSDSSGGAEVSPY